MMRSVTEERCDRMMSAKLIGTQNLRARYPDSRLVAFSSSSAVFGVVGQATYSAANAYLDELLGGDAIQWGGWGEAGMSADLNITPMAGERYVSVADGLEVLGRIIDTPKGTISTPVCVLDVEWS